MINLKVDGTKLTLEADVEAILDKRIETGSLNYREWFEGDFKSYVADVLESYLCNGWDILAPEDYGCLTEGIIITNGVYVWWDGDYQVIDFLEKVLNNCQPYPLIYVGEFEELLPK